MYGLAEAGSSRRRQYHEEKDILLPVAPAPPSQAMNATERKRPTGNASSLGSLLPRGRLMTRRYCPSAKTAFPVAFTASAILGTILPMPEAVASPTPPSEVHSSRDTGSEPSPISAYGRSPSFPAVAGNSRAIWSTKVLAFGSSLEAVGSSHVR